MSRIDIAVPASPATVAAPKGAHDERTTKLDDVFQKLVKKLDGELAKNRKDKGALPGEATDDDAGNNVATKRSKPSLREAQAVRETSEDRDVPGTDAIDAPIETKTDLNARPPTLPELLQSLPADAKAAKHVVSAEQQNRQAGHVATALGRAQTAKANAERLDSASADTADGPGRNPFAALTSLLAKETVGTAPEPAVPELPVKSPKFTLIARETHFEPIVRTPPAQQVAELIVSNIAGVPEESGESTVASAPMPELENLSLRTASDGPLKILHIKLEPDQLGEVSVKMRLVGGSLEVRLEASRAETADLLSRDKDMLHKLLRASGYSPDVVTIQAASESGSSQSANGQTGQNGASSHTPSPFQGSEHSDGRHHDDETASAHDHLPSSENVHDDSASAADGNLYL